MVGDWSLVVVGSGWQLAVGRRWRLAAVGGWRLVAVGGWRLWRLAIDGRWRLAVGGPLGRSLTAVKKKSCSLRTTLHCGVYPELLYGMDIVPKSGNAVGYWCVAHLSDGAICSQLVV